MLLRGGVGPVLAARPARPHTASSSAQQLLRRASRRNSVAAAAMFSWWPFGGGDGDGKKGKNDSVLQQARRGGTQAAPKEAPPGLELATMGGGCFWGLELAFQRVPGVSQTYAAYAGGSEKSPTYDAVCSGFTGHAEVVHVVFDPKVARYEALLDVFFDKHDPTTRNRQGGDVGPQYRSIILAHSPAQRAAAQRKIDALNAALGADKDAGGGAGGLLKRVLGRRVTTELADAQEVWLAERYHQQYLERGGRFGRAQSAAKGCSDPIRCYG